MKSALVLFAYAAILVTGGVYAFLGAPEGANAATALIVPGACAAVMIVLGFIIVSAMPDNPKSAERVHIAAIVLALVFAIAFGFRATSAAKAQGAYITAQSAWQTAVTTNDIEDSPEAKIAFFEARNAPDHSKAYLGNTLWILMGFSALAMVAMLATRPGKRLRPARTTPDEDYDER